MGIRCIECGRPYDGHLSGCSVKARLDAERAEVPPSYTLRLPAQDGGVIHVLPEYGAELRVDKRTEGTEPGLLEMVGWAVGWILIFAAVGALFLFDFTNQACKPIAGC